MDNDVCGGCGLSIQGSLSLQAIHGSVTIGYWHRDCCLDSGPCSPERVAAIDASWQPAGSSEPVLHALSTLNEMIIPMGTINVGTTWYEDLVQVAIPAELVEDEEDFPDI